VTMSYSDDIYIRIIETDHAPIILSVGFFTSVGYAGSMLNVTVNATDAESDAVQYLYQWYVNGEEIFGATEENYSGPFTRGDIVVCIITPYDGNLYGTPFMTVGLVISNSAPTLKQASILPLSPTTKDLLTVTPTGYADNDSQDVTASYLYQWQIYNTTQSAWVDIPGANSATLDYSLLKAGDKVRCVVTPFDGNSTGAAMTSNEVTIQEAPGVFPAAEVATISGMIFVCLFLVILLLYLLGKIGRREKKDDQQAAVPAQPTQPEPPKNQ